MFVLKRDKLAINLQVSPNIPGAESWYWTFTLTKDSEPDAQLLINAIDEELQRRLRDIRQEAYAQGWRDAKAKKARETWFSRWF